MNLNSHLKIKKQVSEKLIQKYKGVTPSLSLSSSDDYSWIKTQSSLPWFDVPINIPITVIKNEINLIRHLFVGHRDDFGENFGWKSFCIHGKSFDATREDSYYKDNREHSYTNEALLRMPNTVNFFKTQFPFLNYQRLRIMLLEPGGYICAHKDSEKSGLGPINIAITQPKECHFVMDNFGEVPFSEGSCMWIDTSNLHTVFNYSNHPRYHIIVHGEPNKNFKNLIVNKYNEIYND